VYNPIPGILENSPASNNYEGGFSIELIVKDIRIALSCAESVGLELPMLNACHDFYSGLLAYGFGRKDFAFTFECYFPK
jgi:3-hydroxyisobutyrate dehydrogenase